MGRIEAICISAQRGTGKQPVARGELLAGFGLAGDAHGGDWHRQVSLLALEKIEDFRREGAVVDYGAFGENLVVSGVDLASLPVGTKFQCGQALLELTQLGKDCHSHCAIYQQVGRCIMPVEGVFSRVLQGGPIAVGDELTILPYDETALLTAAVVTLSDRSAAGARQDSSGSIIVSLLQQAGYQVEEQLLLPDDDQALQKALIHLADRRQINLVLTTGGTGFSPRDVTPEATLAVAERLAPGIAEAIRAYSCAITPRGMLSRGCAVLRGRTLIINLPGSPRAVQQILDYLLPVLDHGLRIAAGTADR